jgi:hypothetical protein
MLQRQNDNRPKTKSLHCPQLDQHDASRPQSLEDHPDHHEEIQTPTRLDILTFLHFIYGTGFHGEF